MHPIMTIVSALLVASACAENTPHVFDGQYRVAILQTADTCKTVSIDTNAPRGLTTRLDLFRRSDGLYDLHWIDGWVPDLYTFTAVDLGDGDVSHGVGGATEVVGTLTTEVLDLELVQRAHEANGQPCERHVTV